MCLAIPGRVVSIGSENALRIGRVQFGGIIRRVLLDFVPEVVVGEYVLVHVGFAIARVDAVVAEETYRALQELGMLEDELPPEEPSEEAAEAGLR